MSACVVFLMDSRFITLFIVVDDIEFVSNLTSLLAAFEDKISSAFGLETLWYIGNIHWLRDWTNTRLYQHLSTVARWWIALKIWNDWMEPNPNTHGVRHGFAASHGNRNSSHTARSQMLSITSWWATLLDHLHEVRYYICALKLGEKPPRSWISSLVNDSPVVSLPICNRISKDKVQ